MSETESNNTGKTSSITPCTPESSDLKAQPESQLTNILSQSKPDAERRKRRRKNLVAYAVNPEDDPEYTCCCGWNLHNSTFLLIMLTFIMWLGMMLVCVYWYKKRLNSTDAAITIVMSSLSMGSYVFLMVGNRLRLPRLYVAYGVVSVSLLPILGVVVNLVFVGALYTFFLTLGTMQLATLRLLDVSHDISYEKQTAITATNLYRIIVAFATGSVCIAHIWTWYVVYRDWNFVRTYPLRGKKGQSIEADSLGLASD